ncbi:MAG: alanine racemase [Thermodesulfobacteriota bacterium]
MTSEAAREYQRYREVFRGERLPLAFVDLDRFDRNVAYVARTQKDTGKTVRVHTKSLRCARLIRRVLEVGGDKYRGLMCFTVEEAEFLSERGFYDFLVAYPTVQSSDLARLVGMIRAGRVVSVMADSVEHLEALDRAGREGGVKLRACLDVDLSYRPLGSSFHLGVRRSPLRTAGEALAVARASLDLTGVEIDSVMGYEGHIAGLSDDLPGRRLKSWAVRLMKKASIREFTPRRGGIVAELKELGLNLRAVNGGGSGSLASTGRDPSVTEVTAGSAFYAPGLFHHFREVSFTPAAFFALQVVRRPAPNLVTCLGGGYVASGVPGRDRLPVPVYPEGLKILPLEGAGEVQTPFLLPPDCPELGLGDPVFLQHAKGGELAERFNELYLVQGDRIVDKVKTYRGEGRAFL